MTFAHVPAAYHNLSIKWEYSSSRGRTRWLLRKRTMRSWASGPWQPILEKHWGICLNGILSSPKFSESLAQGRSWLRQHKDLAMSKWDCFCFWEFWGTAQGLITRLHYFNTQVPTMMIKRNLITHVSHQNYGPQSDCGENWELALFAVCNIKFDSVQRQRGRDESRMWRFRFSPAQLLFYSSLTDEQIAKFFADLQAHNTLFIGF